MKLIILSKFKFNDINIIVVAEENLIISFIYKFN